MSLRKAAEMALAKLDHLWEIGIDAEYKVELLPEIHALRQALAQPEQEPVAWINSYGFWKYKPKDIDALTPLYTAPPKREWVGLTDEEIDLYALDIGVTANKAPAWIVVYAKDIEAKLKEKNT